MNGYSPDLYVLIIVVGLRHGNNLMTLTSFQGRSLVYMISFEKNGLILAKLT